MWIGIFLICVGILYILSNAGVLQGDVWDYALPVIFILLGISIIVKRVKRNRNTTITIDAQNKE